LALKDRRRRYRGYAQGIQRRKRFRIGHGRTVTDRGLIVNTGAGEGENTAARNGAPHLGQGYRVAIVQSSRVPGTGGKQAFEPGAISCIYATGRFYLETQDSRDKQMGKGMGVALRYLGIRISLGLAG